MVGAGSVCATRATSAMSAHLLPHGTPPTNDHHLSCERATMRTLILGGARSGKSAFAEGLCSPADPVDYIATARGHADDADFSARIAEHRDRRPAHWRTVDEIDLVDYLVSIPAATPSPPQILVDDLGTWLVEQITAAQAWDAPRGTIAHRTTALCAAVAALPTHVTITIVTPEVGLSVSPEHASGRLFRDELGRLNADLAALCDRVYLVVAGRALALPPTPDL